MPLHPPEPSEEQRAELLSAAIKVGRGTLRQLRPGEDRMQVLLGDREEPLAFDVVYPALGSAARSELAKALGVPLSEEGCVPAGELKANTVGGLFAAGDVEIGRASCRERVCQYV